LPEIYITLARALSALDLRGGPCRRSDYEHRLPQSVAIGYRGNATGLPNVCDNPGRNGGWHAEENAIIHCDAPRAEPKIAFATVLPCRACAKRLINLGGVQDLYPPVAPTATPA
jgi:hypothetical protein